MKGAIGYEDYKKFEMLEDIYESKLLEATVKKGKFYSMEEVIKKTKSKQKRGL